jgi:hypothetical protein
MNRHLLLARLKSFDIFVVNGFGYSHIITSCSGDGRGNNFNQNLGHGHGYGYGSYFNNSASGTGCGVGCGYLYGEGDLIEDFLILETTNNE